MRILAIFAIGTLLLSSAAYGQGRSPTNPGAPNPPNTDDPVHTVGEPQLTRTTEPFVFNLTIDSWGKSGPTHTLEPTQAPTLLIEGVRDDGAD